MAQQGISNPGQLDEKHHHNPCASPLSLPLMQSCSSAAVVWVPELASTFNFKIWNNQKQKSIWNRSYVMSWCQTLHRMSKTSLTIIRKSFIGADVGCFLKMGQPRPLFHLFLFFHTENLLSSQRDSNSDRRSIRQERWPLDHHHGPDVDC